MSDLGGIRVAVLGGDQRELILVSALIERGAEVTVAGYPPLPEIARARRVEGVVEAVRDADAVIAPMSNTDERGEIRALRDEVLGKVGASGFVDVRSPEEFRGEKLAPDHLPQEQAQVPGHIAGAANVPWAKAANEDGTFKSAEELRALYEAEGITGDREIIAYCRIGERSSHTWFALQELLGYPNVKNYDGSWTEYGSLVGAPVEKG